jgi:hypothetical protein
MNKFINFPGRIVEFFPTTQTATVLICAEETYDNLTAIGQSRVRVPIEDVPVHTLSGGGFAFTNPIKAGDTCVILFSQVGYDHWFHNDKDVAGQLSGLPHPALKRSFDVDDGYAMVGFNTLPRAIQNFSADNSQWRNASADQLMSLNADGSIDIISPTKLVINVIGDVVMTATGSIDLTADGDVNITGANVNITGGTINLN